MENIWDINWKNNTNAQVQIFNLYTRKLINNLLIYMHSCTNDLWKFFIRPVFHFPLMGSFLQDLTILLSSWTCFDKIIDVLAIEIIRSRFRLRKQHTHFSKSFHVRVGVKTFSVLPRTPPFFQSMSMRCMVYSTDLAKWILQKKTFHRPRKGQTDDTTLNELVVRKHKTIKKIKESSLKVIEAICG